MATRLVRHFVADEPPPELVGDLAGVFLSSGGDLRAVTRALFTAEAFYDPAYRRGKVKRPFEFLVSALRVVDAELGPMAALTLEDVLRSLQHLPYAAPAPTGYPVTADAWLSHGAMIDRMTFAFDLSQGALQWSPPTATAGALILRAELPAEPAVTFDPWRMLDGGVTRAVLPGRGTADPADGRLQVGEAQLPPAALRALVRQVLERTIYGVSTSELEATILEELASRPADPEVLLRRAIALAVGSPEFQRH